VNRSEGGPTGCERVDCAEVLYLGRKAVRPGVSVFQYRRSPKIDERADQPYE
jgi:hypothetical protein